MDDKTERFDTGTLGFLRSFVERIPMLMASTGAIPRFPIVIDANALVRAMLQRLRYPGRGTLIEELTRATILEVHAPRWLEIEMRSAIPQVAASSGFTEHELWRVFESYRAMIKWDDNFASPGRHGCDPKDVPYVVLAEKIGAVGIFTNDRHIAELGGHPLTMDFIIAVRDYSRSAAKSIGARATSVMIPGSILLVLMGLLVILIKAIARLRPDLKLVMLAGLGVALAIPSSRKWLADVAELAGTAVSDATPQVLGVVRDLLAVADVEKPRTDEALIVATRMTRKPRRRLTPAAAARRAQTRKAVTVTASAQMK